jgi:hypothetical protein
MVELEIGWRTSRVTSLRLIDMENVIRTTKVLMTLENEAKKMEKVLKAKAIELHLVSNRKRQM